jgi:putative aldouronate transport system substrate-binding protein
MKKFLMSMLLALMAVTFLSANGQQSNSSDESQKNGPVWIEMWSSANRLGSYEEDHPINKITVEEIGIGVRAPLLSWNGGKDYLERLNLAIVSNDMPDVFQPWGGNEYDLAKQGALMPLDDLLPRYAPNLWNNISQETWNIVRANSPDGKIYYIPNTWKDFTLTAFIRADWLNRVGLDVPQTISEYENVLRAFKTQDANGNGDANDEIPTSGRENARWMDHLFAPFGVAMYEGNPEWDIYDGELTYSAVTPNMKAALKWVTDLYAEGLLDTETLVNTTKMWDGKIRDDRVGSWYHGAQWVISRLSSIEKLNPEVEVAQLPVLKAEGFNGFYTARAYNGPAYVFSAADESKVIAALKYFNFFEDTASKEKYLGGWPGFNVTTENGQLKSMTPPENVGNMYADYILSPEFYEDSWYFGLKDSETGHLYKNALDILKGSKSYLRQIMGQGLSTSIYEGYPDIPANRLYREYASLIILGEYDIDKFDEFVEKWYAQGGQEVTERAREAYSKIK